MAKRLRLKTTMKQCSKLEVQRYKESDHQNFFSCLTSLVLVH